MLRKFIIVNTQSNNNVSYTNCEDILNDLESIEMTRNL